MKTKIKLVKELDDIAAGTVIEVSEEYAVELKDAGIGEDFVEIDKEVSVVEAEVKEIKEKVEMKKVVDASPVLEVKAGPISKEAMLRKSMVLAKSRATGNWSNDARAYDQEEKAILGQGEALNVGGALVSDAIADGIYDIAMATSVIAGKAQSQVIPAGYNSLTVRQNKSTTATPASYKGVALGVFAEGATITPASTVGFTSANASVNKLIALNYQTNEIVEDVPGISSSIERIVGEAFGMKLDEEIVFGTDSLLTELSGDLSVGTVALVGAAAVTAASLNEFISKASNPAGSEWYISGATFYGVIQGLEDTAGNRIVQPNIIDPLKPILLGFPVNITPCLEAAGASKVDIMFGSVGDGYVLGTKGGVKFAQSMSLEFLTDQQAFRWVLRIAGMPTVYSTLTLKDGRTVSPMVAIARS